MSHPGRRLGILISGRGSNMLAIHDAIRDGRLSAEIALVASNKADAAGLLLARDRGLPTAVIAPPRGTPRAEHDAMMAAALEAARVDVVCLAGYMRILGEGFVKRFPGRILNIHPSLLPAFPGLDVQRAALEHGVKYSGCTVHLVDEQVDHGPIVLQSVVEVRDDDTPESLAERILEKEHDTYWRAVDRVLSGRMVVDGRRVRAT